MKESIVFKIVSIFVVLSIIPVLSINYLFNLDYQKSSQAMVQESLQKLAEEKSQVLSLTFKEIELEAENLAHWAENYLSVPITNKDYMNFPYQYSKNTNGVLSRQLHYENLVQENRDNNISNIFFPNSKTLTTLTINDIINTERLDAHFKRTKLAFPISEWIYIITPDNLLRVYPFTPVDTFESDHNFKKDIYYILADEEHNPSRKAVWTNPYYDWCGKGWVITCSYPIYRNNNFSGVICIDITLSSLSKTIADFNIATSGFAFLIDQKGSVIYHPNLIPDEEIKGQIIPTNLLMNSHDKSYENIIREMMAAKNGFREYLDTSNHIKKAIAFANIDGANWSIGIEVDVKSYAKDNKQVTNNLLITVILIMPIITLISIYLFTNISKPIIILARNAEYLSKGSFDQTIKVTSQDEIGLLTDTFNKMSLTIKTYTDDLIKKQRQMETIFNSVPGILFIRDLEYNIQIINKEGIDSCHKLEVEILNHKCFEVLAKKTSPCQNCPVTASIYDKKEVCTDVIMDNKIYHVCSYPIIDSNNTLTGMVVYGKDVTEDLILQAELSHAEKFSNIGQVAAGVTHELKNPLSIIRGSHYLLVNMLNNIEDMELRKEALDLLAQMDQSLKHSENIISNLLGFSKQSVKSTEILNVIVILSQILMLEKNSFIRNNINVETQYESEEIFINANTDSIKYILLNLICNAIQAMPNGGKLHIYVNNLHDSSEKIEIKITDTGHGIPEDLRQKIFEPFFTTKDQNKGSGLGLWIVQNEIKKHKGELLVDSKVGLGTCFTIIFPCQ